MRCLLLDYAGLPCVGGYWTLLNTLRDNEPPGLPDTFSPTFRDFIKQCLIKDPLTRPGATELLKVSSAACLWWACLVCRGQLLDHDAAISCYSIRSLLTASPSSPIPLKRRLRRYALHLTHHTWHLCLGAVPRLTAFLSRLHADVSPASSLVLFTPPFIAGC